MKVGERIYKNIQIECKTRDTKELQEKIQEYVDKGYRLVSNLGQGFYMFDATNIITT